MNQIIRTNTVFDAENSKTTARQDTTGDDTIDLGDHDIKVAKEDTNNDDAWTLLENQYRYKGIGKTCTNYKGDPKDGMNCLNETPEELNGEPHQDGMEDEQQRLNACIIL